MALETHSSTATSDSPDPVSALSDLDREKLPRHVAIIMDGNGRWAQRQGMPRIEGHRRGANTVREIVTAAAELGIEQLTLYCLSSENWKRPAAELSFLMFLLEKYLIEERKEIVRQELRFSTIGLIDQLPEAIQAEIQETKSQTEQFSGMRLCLALNYGGRQEIVNAVQKLAHEVQEGRLDPDAIDEKMIGSALDTSGMPDPDLVIRTAGEMRFSNFLLWQISYSELWVTEKHWPEFSRDDFHQALGDFSRRNRRFGGLNK